MENYVEMQTRQQKEFENFPCFFAYNQKQFDEGMKKLGVEQSELYHGAGGMFYRKADSKALADMMERFDKEKEEGFKNDTFLYDAIIYEMGNHEYGYTMDADAVFSALGLTCSEIRANERMVEVFIRAERDYLDRL